MANKENDSKILLLKKKIEEKKTKLKKSTKFTPITNCSLELNGQRYNLNVLQKQQLQLLAVQLKSFIIANSELKLDELIISGYSCSDWLIDILSKLEVVSRKDEEVQLKKMEDKLDELLSNEKRVELELDSIADLLGE